MARKKEGQISHLCVQKRYHMSMREAFLENAYCQRLFDTSRPRPTRPASATRGRITFLQ